MKFKTESRFLHYLLLFHSCFFLNPVSSDDNGTITMVSVQVNTEEGGKGKFVHVCGGTLITNSVIFTGCSCITKPPKPGAEDKDKVDLLTPEQVRVSAGVSEAKKGDQIRLQSAVAYALSVHDLCDTTYVYNYGMVKLTTSFLLENGLELSHALSLDMSNYEKSIKSMGPKDCWTEIWTSVESPPVKTPPKPAVTVPTPKTMTSSSTWSPAEYNDTLDETPLVESPEDEPSGEEESSAEQSSGLSTPSEESGEDDDDSGTEPSEDASGGSGITTSQGGFTNHSINTTALKTESKVALKLTVKPLPHETSTKAVEILSDSPTLPVTFGPLMKGETVEEYDDEDGSSLDSDTEEQNATEIANIATNTTSMIHANETVTNGTRDTNKTAVAPQGMAANNESLSAFNSSASKGAANATGNAGVPGNEKPAQTPITAAGKGRRRRFPILDRLNVPYEGYHDPAMPVRVNRQAGPVPKDAPPSGANITAGSANATSAGELGTGLNGTVGANASNAAGVGVPGGMNGTNAWPSSNASDASVSVITSLNATGGDNETIDLSPITVEVNTSAVVNQTESANVTIEVQTKPNIQQANTRIETVKEAETTIQIKTIAVDLVTKNVTDKLLVSTGIPEVTTGSVGVSEGTGAIDEESGTDESGEPDSGSGKDGGIEEGSAESEEVDSSGTSEHPKEVSSVEVSSTKLVPAPSPTTKPATPPPKRKSKSQPGPAPGGTPRGVGRMPVSILDWKECEGLVCPDPSKKCDSSSDDTKWCLSALKEGARVCEADTRSPVYCKSALMGILSNVGLACPKDTSKGIAVGLDQAFEYIKSMMGMPDFQKKVPPAETKQRKSGTPKEHNPSATQAIIGSIIAFLLI
uniref:Catalase-peroxidase n=1 Tax=Lygus hesperus TaxID=30085 RepID=A0A0A9XSG2_LYGHE